MRLRYDVMMPHNAFVCVSKSMKKTTFGQNDCTIWETRKVRECSGILILGSKIEKRWKTSRAMEYCWKISTLSQLLMYLTCGKVANFLDSGTR